ncbi:hypothetical protein METP3_02188 [Methanosarcinales archaeon]|nr:hypothetical protein METP3_02188 [Methanosarcinales archaeon]
MAGMGFYTGALTLPALIDKICDELLLVAGGSWTEPDTVGEWVDTAVTYRKRALKYDGGTDEQMYITFEAVKNGYTTITGLPNPNQTVDEGAETYYYSGNGARGLGKGLRFGFSQGWNGVSHTPTPSLTNTFIAYWQRYPSTGSSSNNPEEWRCTGNIDTTPLDYWLWIENNGFALMAIPEHQSMNNSSGAFILICERNANKEYTDGLSNFFAYARNGGYECNAPRSDNNYNGQRHECVLRPFSYYSATQKDFYYDPNTHYRCPYQGPHMTWDATHLGHKDDPIGVEFAKSAHKSSGNGKVYYIKPIVHNNIHLTSFKHETAFEPIFQSELFLDWRPDSGIIHGDILKFETTNRQYLCLDLRGNYMGSPLRYAIKYHDD